MIARSAFASIALLAVAATAGGDRVACPGTGIRAPGWDAHERHRVCDASAAAIDFLRAAGLSRRGEVLTIRPLPPAEVQEGHPLIGCCDTRAGEIRILPYEAAVAASRKFPPAFGMPMSPALWESFVSHETAHAVAEPNFAAGVRRQAASEYIAAVTQLATLPADLRKAILDRFDVDGFGDAREISMVLYDFDPGAFAVKAWRHYTSLGDRGPAFVARLLAEGSPQ